MQMHLPINRMLGKDPLHPSTIPVDQQREWYAAIFDALAGGGGGAHLLQERDAPEPL